MPRLESQHPERSFYGEGFGSKVARYLNDFPGIAHRINLEPGQKRILALLELLRPIVFGEPVYFPGDPRLKDVRTVNRFLHRYKTYSLVGPAEDCVFHGRVRPFRLSFINVKAASNSAKGYETNAAYDLMRLAELNSVNSLRTCKQCALWFFAKFSHQQFCRKECRIKHNSASDTWKEYKRNKAREYYQLHKSGKVRER